MSHPLMESWEPDLTTQPLLKGHRNLYIDYKDLELQYSRKKKIWIAHFTITSVNHFSRKRQVHVITKMTAR